METQALTGERGRIGWRRRRESFRSRRRSRRSWRRASTGFRPRTSGSSRPPRSSARKCRLRCCRPSRTSPEDALRRGLATLQAAEFLYETQPFSRPRVHVQACPDPRRCLRQPAPRPAAHAPSARFRNNRASFIPTACRSTSTKLAHHALRGEAVEGSGRLPSVKLEPRPLPAPPTATRPPTSSKRWRHSVICRRRASSSRQPVDLRFDLRTSLFPLGLLSRVLGYLEEAESLARTLDDRRRITRGLGLHEPPPPVTGRLNEARQFAESARTIAEALGDFPARIGATFIVSGVLLLLCGQLFLRPRLSR